MQSKDAAKATAYDGLLSRQKETTAASTCHEATEKRALSSSSKNTTMVTKMGSKVNFFREVITITLKT